MNEQRIFGYATHTVPLVLALESIGGDVLELGVGYGSTPLLHNLCIPTNVSGPIRNVVSLEDNLEWYERFAGYQSSWHLVVFAKDIITETKRFIESRRFGVVLVDNDSTDLEVKGMFENRIEAVELLKDEAKIVVVHDTDDVRLSTDSRWLDLVDSFKFVSTWNSFPQTTVLSNVFDIFKDTLVTKLSLSGSECDLTAR